MDLFQRGLGEKVDYEAWLRYTAEVIQTPGGKQVWAYLETTITPTIREVINEYLAANRIRLPCLSFSPFENMTLISRTSSTHSDIYTAAPGRNQRISLVR